MDLAHSRHEIDIAGPHNLRAKPDLIPRIARQHDRRRQVRLKEALDILLRRIRLPPNGRKTRPELRHEAQHGEEEPDPRPSDAALAAERECVECAPVVAPGGTEADVREADAAPGEERGEAADGKHPGKSLFLGGGGGQIGEQAEGSGEHDGDKGPAAAIDVGEEAGRLVLLGEGGEGAGGAVDGGVADGEHGEHDDTVHDRVEALDAGVGDGDDKGGGARVVGVGADEAGVGVGDEQADEGQGDDVEDANPPEHLLYGYGERFARLGRLGGGKAYEFRARKGEGGRHEGGAQPFEAVVEGARRVPVLTTDIGAVRASGDIEDDAEDSERA